MRFVCLCYYNAAKMASLSPADLEDIARVCRPRDAELRATGKVVMNTSIGEPPTARTLRDDTVTEGPYAETEEPIGAMFIIEAADMDEAVTIARLHPGVLVDKFGGGIEVRPIETWV